MKKVILYLSLLITCILFACNDEKKLVPSEEDIYGYSIPQGTHDYDEKIVEWNKKYNFFALYKWSPRDLYWTPTAWNEAKKNGEGATYAWTSGYYGEESDEAYVGHQLELIEDVFLSFYPDSTLRRCMPLKMILCKELENVDVRGNRKNLNIYGSYDLLAYNWGGEKILSITPAEKATLKREVNLEFLWRLKGNDKIPVSQLFYSYSDYSTSLTAADFYARGFVYFTNSDRSNTDWKYYLDAIISTSYEDLTKEVPATDRTYHGILNDMKDTKGLIKKKYAAIIAHFKQYGIDLQEIGNTSYN